MGNRLVVPDPLRRLVDAIGVEGDAASMAGTLHAKAESIYAKTLAIPAGTGPVAFTDTGGMSDATDPVGNNLANFGSWVQVTASVGGSPVLLVGIRVQQPGGGGLFSGSSYSGRIQIGMGGSGSEVAIADWTGRNLVYGNLMIGPLMGVRVAAGTRLAARVSSGTGGAGVAGKVAGYHAVPL